METRSKKHHYVPRSILQNFTNGRKHKQIWVFDKPRKAAYADNIDNAGAENYFNTIRAGDRTICFEGRFQSSDDHLARLANTLTRRRTLAALTPQDRSVLANLAAIQLLRVKIIRERFLEMPQLLMKMLQQYCPADSLAQAPAVTTDDNEAKQFCLELLDEAPEFAKLLESKDWSLLIAPKDYPFCISDNPVVMANAFPDGDLGLASRGIEVSWPLHPEVLLAFRCPTIANSIEHNMPVYAGWIRSDPVAHCTRSHVDYYNSLQVLRSLRFLYGSTNEFTIARRMLRDQPQPGTEKPTLMKLGHLGEAIEKTHMPTGKWLVVYGARSHFMCPLEAYSETSSGFSATVSRAYKEHLFHALLNDAPHEQAYLYDDRVAVQMMRGISIVRDASMPYVLHVEHSDPGIRSILATPKKGNASPSTKSEEPP